MQAASQLEVFRLVGQVLAERQLVRLVVDHHRVAERDSATGPSVSLIGMSRSGGFLIRHGTLRSLSEPELQRIDARQLQAAQARCGRRRR
jgi:hypothetical protein